MSKKIAIQMDAIESINFHTDSSILLGREIERRGAELYYYRPSDLSLLNGEPVASLRRLKLSDDENNFYNLGDPKTIELTEMDIIMIRQNPPFDMNYLTSTYILERIASQVAIINNPTEIRNSPEKLLVLDFPDLAPPTLITSSLTEVAKFRVQYGKIILKPLYSFGGDGVFLVDVDDVNLASIFDLMMANYRTPIIVQLYLPEIITAGDKRIIIAAGKPVASLKRVVPEKSIRSNVIVGGTGFISELTDRDHQICERIAPTLIKRNLFLVGIDVIGDYLSEINVTSPTGIKYINNISGKHIEREIWDLMLEALEK